VKNYGSFSVFELDSFYSLCLTKNGSSIHHQALLADENIKLG
jgi:hypothetical protein